MVLRRRLKGYLKSTQLFTTILLVSGLLSAVRIVSADSKSVELSECDCKGQVQEETQFGGCLTGVLEAHRSHIAGYPASLEAYRSRVSELSVPGSRNGSRVDTYV